MESLWAKTLLVQSKKDSVQKTISITQEKNNLFQFPNFGFGTAFGLNAEKSQEQGKLPLDNKFQKPLIVFAIVFAILYALSPPFVEADADPDKKIEGRTSLIKCFVVSVGAAGVVWTFAK